MEVQANAVWYEEELVDIMETKPNLSRENSIEGMTVIVFIGSFVEVIVSGLVDAVSGWFSQGEVLLCIFFEVK